MERSLGKSTLPPAHTLIVDQGAVQTSTATRGSKRNAALVKLPFTHSPPGVLPSAWVIAPSRNGCRV